MIGPELDDAIDRVKEPLEYQAKRRKIDLKAMRAAIEVWESLRPEAIPTGEDPDDEVHVAVLAEDAQVMLYERSVKHGRSTGAYSAGYLNDLISEPIDFDELASLIAPLKQPTRERIMQIASSVTPLTRDFMERYRAQLTMFAQADAGVGLGFGIVRSIRIKTSDVERGEARLDPKMFAVSVYGTSIIAEDEFTPDEECVRRARWSLRYIIATQHDRVLHAKSALLDDDEMDFVRELVELIGEGGVPMEADMILLEYLFAKVQPNNRLFGTTAGREELWYGQVLEVAEFLRDFPTLDTSQLQDVEVRMVEDVRDSVRSLIEDPTFGGAMHKIEGGKCVACSMSAEDAEFRVVCDADARDRLEQRLPLAALPDLYLVKAKLCAPTTGQEID